MYVMFFHFFIFVGYGQLNSTTVLDFFLYQACMTLLFAAFGRRAHCFVMTRIFARFQQSGTLGTSLQIFWNNIGPLSQTNRFTELS